ncbi:MAG: aminotransferase class V-fold PLP-dependent enzyme [Solirubrobacterales bacterium]|nr:aminotransferase class V-fold PLP-dependent enzyme [Solirubrobacterales bacterium]
MLGLGSEDERQAPGAASVSEPARGFASDNAAGAHPEVLEAIAAANVGHAPSYGADAWTARAEEIVRGHFGAESRAFFVFNGSFANVAAIDALTRPYEAVICTNVAHIHVDECGAPERIAGAKLLTVTTEHGKLTPDDLRRWESRRGDEHHPQPRLVSITQATELGTVYTLDETRAIATAAHELGMLVHVDGARLANAAAALDAPLAALTTDAGVDAVSFGGTKNGLLFGEAVVFARPELAERFAYTRKQLGQLASKMRFVSAQFEALLEGDLWRRSAGHANAMAARLAAAVDPIEGVELTHPVEASGVFARLPPATIARLQAELAGGPAFHAWGDEPGEVRWMCAWDTTAEDVDAFAAAIARAMASGSG